MLSNSDYNFEVSVSRESFKDKIISNAMIGCNNKVNRQIRKQYGFDPRSGVSFYEMYITPSELLDYLLTGHAFCNIFNTPIRKKNGGFGSRYKTYENFCYSNVIGIDIDYTSYSTPQEYIDKLRYKPTFWYTSYSHLKNDIEKGYSGARFRMIYVFTTAIDNPYYFRYCASKLNKIIEEDTGEQIKDSCNISCTQYFNGTNINNSYLNVEYGITNYIYDLTDIGVELPKRNDFNYTDFLSHQCYYKGVLKPDYIFNIKRELYRITGKEYYYNSHSRQFVLSQQEVNNSTTINVILEKDRTIDFDFNYELTDPSTSTFSVSTNTILYDWDHNTTSDFLKCSQWIQSLKSTKYIYRMEKEWGDKNYQFIGNDYFALFHFTSKRYDKQGRRKTLFQRMCLRRLLNPEITKEEQVVNTIIDIIRGFDNSDRVLNSDFITKNIDTAYSLSLNEISELYKDSIEYLKSETRPQRGYIIKPGIKDIREITYEILDDYYKQGYTISQNIQLINESTNCSFSKSTLYEYCIDRKIKTDNNKLSDNELIDLLDMSLSYRKNYSLLKDRGIKVGDKRLRGLYNQKKLNESTTINVILEKDRTPHTSVKTATKDNHPILSNDKHNEQRITDTKSTQMLNFSWGINESNEMEWEERYNAQLEINSHKCNEDLLDDVIGWCNDFLGL